MCVVAREIPDPSARGTEGVWLSSYEVHLLLNVQRANDQGRGVYREK